MRPFLSSPLRLIFIFYESGNCECLAHYGKFKDKIIDEI